MLLVCLLALEAGHNTGRANHGEVGHKAKRGLSQDLRMLKVVEYVVKTATGRGITLSGRVLETNTRVWNQQIY